MASGNGGFLHRGGLGRDALGKLALVAAGIATVAAFSTLDTAAEMAHKANSAFWQGAGVTQSLFGDVQPNYQKGSKAGGGSAASKEAAKCEADPTRDGC